jgi:hypothetical protein
MSYEEINKSVYGNDVFTNGAEGRYTKPKATSETSDKNGEKKKRAPKAPVSTTDDPTEHPYENGHTDETVKTKKKNRKTHENGEIQNGEETSQVIPSVDGETVVKTKKKRAPKIESNNETIDLMPITEEEPIKKKKSKTPKSTPIDEDFEIIENSTINELEPSTEVTTKIKKSKKRKTPKTSTDPSADTLQDVETNNSYEYSTNPGIYLFI